MTHYHPPKNWIAVKPDKTEDKIRDSGLILPGNIKEFWTKSPIDTGTVVAAPEGYTKHALFDLGKAHKSDKDYVQIIEGIVREGDRVKFHRNTIESCFEGNSWHVDESGRMVIFIQHRDIHYIQRGDEIIPVGQHSIVEPIPMSEEEMTTASGILMDHKIRNQIQRGILRWKGQDPEGLYEDVKVGDTLAWSLRDAKLHIPIEVNGKEYIRVRWMHLLGKMVPGVTEEELEERKRKKETFHEQFRNQKKYLLPG